MRKVGPQSVEVGRKRETGERHTEMKSSKWTATQNKSETIIREDDSPEPELRARNFKPGIYFPELVNRRAFVDRVVLSIEGKPLCQPLKWEDKGIRAGVSNYARVKRGSILLTGNPFNLKYGKTKTFKNIPYCQLTLRSEQEPLTGAQAHHSVKELIEGTPCVKVSEVELTFDVDDWSTETLYVGVTSRAEHHYVKETLYIGQRKSNWQVRLYPKADNVARVEFILRRQFLKSCGIEGVDEVLKLKAVEIWDKIRIQEIDTAALEANLAEFVLPEWKQETMLFLARKYTVQETKEILKRGYGNTTKESALVDSTIQLLLETMQKAFLW